MLCISRLKTCFITYFFIWKCRFEYITFVAQTKNNNQFKKQDYELRKTM